MSVLAQSRQRLSALLRPLRRYAGSGELRIRTDQPERVIGAIRAQFAAGTVTEIDGVTIDFPDWWVNVRPSNTEPVVKLVMEATTAELLARRTAEVREAITRAGGAFDEHHA
jgi:phosphomannomutase